MAVNPNALIQAFNNAQFALLINGQQAMQQQIQDNQLANQQQMQAMQQALQQQIQAANMASAAVLNNIQNQVAILGPPLTVIERNQLHRLFNKTCDSRAILQTIVRDDNMVPDNFPVNRHELTSLNGDVVTQLLHFYGLAENGIVRVRRSRLVDFIEVGLVV